MASLKKNYSFKTKRTIWQLIPAKSNVLVIEERDTNSREAFFNVLTLDRGKVVLKEFQLEEKYWVGIESVYKDIIFFHKFKKPDMPGHRGIYAFDIQRKKIIWHNDEVSFLFLKDDKIYAFQTTFDGRTYFTLDYLTGDLINDWGTEFAEINKLREESAGNDFSNTFLFPNQFDEKFIITEKDVIMQKLIAYLKHEGKIQWLWYNDLVMFNYHKTNLSGKYTNYFKVYNTIKGNYLFEETLNSSTENFIPDSFFIIGNLLFLLYEKTKLVVYTIKQ